MRYGDSSTLEHWPWRYGDLRTGQICRTTFQLTAEQAAGYPEAERIDGSMLLREAADDVAFEATGPQVAGHTRRLLAGRSLG